MKNKYKVAVIGCGSIANAHLEGYSKLSKIEIKAVVDTNRAAREMYMKEYQILNGYENLESMLSEMNPDIVSICVWHKLHDVMTEKIANYPSVKGIICEKPMAIGLGNAEKMIEVCKKNNVKLIISHQRRFTPGWMKAKDVIQSGLIGVPIRGEIRVKDGLLNWGTHSIDGVRFVLGEPEAQWVFGALERSTNKFERDTAIEDCCMGLVQFEDNLQFFIQSDLLDNNCDAGRFTIIGTNGMIYIEETKIRLFNDSSNGWKNIKLDLDKDDKAIGGNTNAMQVEELIEWIEKDKESRSSARIAIKTQEIMMAIYESARKNKVIKLPLKEKNYPLELMIDEKKLHLYNKEKYDIREFLNRDNIDEDLYQNLKAQGLEHNEIMQKIHSKK
ncbi:MAG: hypothetical protein CL746_04770 [Chloroflexi bacterium]|nr:hypothetical protein [Chloroflexota bacterium]|tara:strand:- start:739 stop:1899 length:1161 start_codon:yes stop_codon:yes gene_type:complete